MRSMNRYPKAAVERAMKVQEVILRQKDIGGVQRLDPGQPQLLRQPPLPAK